MGGLRYKLIYGNDTNDYRPQVALKVFDLTPFWRAGLQKVTICVSPSWCFDVAKRSDVADFLLAYEDCPNCDPRNGQLYADTVARLWYDGGAWKMQFIKTWPNDKWVVDGRVVKDHGSIYPPLEFSSGTVVIDVYSYITNTMNAEVVIR